MELTPKATGEREFIGQRKRAPGALQPRYKRCALGVHCITVDTWVRTQRAAGTTDKLSQGCASSRPVFDKGTPVRKSGSQSFRS